MSKPSTLPTATEIVHSIGDRVLRLVDELLEISTLRDINTDTSSVVFIGPSYAWNDLDDEGRRLQSRLLNELVQYSALVEALARVAPESARSDADHATEQLREIADRSHLSWFDSPAKASTAAHEAVAAHRALVDGLDDPSEGQPLLVPDASAVIANPNLVDWAFVEFERFMLVLTPSFLEELDGLKATNRPESVRTKAASVVKQIKEFGRRGNLGVGVPLRRDRSTVRSIAVEPDFTTSLPWLQPTVMDDRYVASAVELMRRHPRSPVVIVTDDINMQNKARNADVPFVEPPEGAAPSTPAPKRAKVRILSLDPQGGSTGEVSFRLEVQSHEQTPVRAFLTATVGDAAAEVNPRQVDLLVNAIPTKVGVRVPRPSLGDLVPEFDHETTLYGETLEVIVTVDGVDVARERWNEIVYSEAENADRHRIQQRRWRIGRGQGSPENERAQWQADTLARMDEERAQHQHRHWIMDKEW